MILALCAGLVMASPEQPFPRIDERIRDRRYADISGDGPAYGRYRRRSGPIHAWTWTDGVVEHYERLDGGRVVEARRYSASGQPMSTVLFATSGAAASVEVGGTPVDVSGWAAQTVAGVTLTAPGKPEAQGDAITWAGDGWRLTALPFPEAADPFSDSFRSALASHCGCTLLDRTTTWLDGRPAARYQIRLPDPDGAKVGELWAVRSAEHTLLLASVASNRETLVTGRAVAALLDWK